jgi:hypothetical protein
MYYYYYDIDIFLCIKYKLKLKFQNTMVHDTRIARIKKGDVYIDN